MDIDMIKFSGYADFEWAVKLNRFGLKFLGLWPEEGSSLKDRLNSNLRLFGSFIVITCFITMPSLHLLLIVWGDITAMIDNILFTLPLLAVSAKMLILWWKRETLSSLITMIAEDWIKSKSEDERNIMIRRAQNARLLIICSYFIILSSLLFVIVAAASGYTLSYVTNITDLGRILPLQVHYIYDTSVSPQFELTFLVQCIGLVMVALSYTSTDNFLGLLVFHICGQLENLTNRLYRMHKFKDFTVALRINVMDHIRLIRSVTTIEDTFTLLLLLLFLYFGIMFCTYGFLVVTVIIEEEEVSIKRAIFLILVICTAFIHMCVYCAVGELLVIKISYLMFHAKYEEVYNALNTFEWYTLKMKDARNMIFLLLRMSKPLYITAGKILPMTMATFCSILKTSGGYISVLLANRN